MKRQTIKTVAIVWAVVVLAVALSTATTLIVGRTDRQHWVTEEEYATIQRYRRLEEVRKALMDGFYQPLDEEKLMTGALRGMTGAAEDVYTFYYTPEEMKKERNDTNGRYEGIGVQVERNAEGMIEVVRVYPNTPSSQAGIQTGDYIVSVDGEPVSGATVREYMSAVNMMRGELNTEVALGVKRGERTLTFSVKRSDIHLDYAEYTILDGNIGYVSIAQFTGNAPERFEEALAHFREHGVRGMVIDLRNNPGGLLDVVNRIADSILPKGVIVYVQDRNGERKNYYSDEAMYDVPLAVLVNGMSASASEILAASVQALNRGVVVGVTTYGKGVVQTVVTFPEDGAGMQYTTASYYDANGRSINGVGVTPDIEVPLEGMHVPVQPDPEHDNQLSRAIEAITEPQN